MFRKIKIGDLGIVVTGKTPRTDIPDNYGGDIPFLTPTDLNGEKYVLRTAQRVSKKGALEVKKNILPPLTICFSCIGTIGNVVLTNCETIANQQFNSIILNKSFDPDYIYYVLRLYGKKLRDKIGNNSTVLSIISKSNFVDILISIEDNKDKQIKIGRVLSKIDERISLNKRMNAELEAMAKQLYDYWFVQFDFPDENGKPYKSSGGKMVYNEILKREIPEGWKDSILSEIANITMGQSPDGSSYNEEGNGTVFYQGSTDFGIRFPSVRMYTTEPSRFAAKGDILMSVRAPVGDTNIANTDCCIGRGLAALNSKIGSITYLYFILDYLKAKFDLLNSVGTTFGAITKDELFTLPVIKPDDDVLKCFEGICSPIFDKQMNIGFEINELTHLRDSLLPMLMNGQVTVE